MKNANKTTMEESLGIPLYFLKLKRANQPNSFVERKHSLNALRLFEDQESLR